MDIGAMDRSMTAGGPASALAQESGVERIANVNLAGLAMLNLGMAAETEVHIAFGQHFAVD